MTMGDALCPHGQIVAPDALKAKYPHACHMPRLDCLHCHGKGEEWLEGAALHNRVLLELGQIPDHEAAWWPCVCLSVGHELVKASDGYWHWK